MFKIFKSSFIAGICISLGCMAFLNVGGILGAVLFTFGLLTVVHYKIKLYTGTAGFFRTKKEFADLPIILIGNILGCAFMAYLTHITLPDVVESAGEILQKRMALQYGSSLFLASLCGFIMTTAVNFGRDGRYLPLLYGVPLFIMCGFLHSIADAFYYMAAPIDVITSNFPRILIMYGILVVGNFIGCNFYRVINRE